MMMFCPNCLRHYIFEGFYFLKLIIYVYCFIFMKYAQILYDVVSHGKYEKLREMSSVTFSMFLMIE
jgi:hypothetical protein